MTCSLDTGKSMITVVVAHRLILYSKCGGYCYTHNVCPRSTNGRMELIEYSTLSMRIHPLLGWDLRKLLGVLRDEHVLF